MAGRPRKPTQLKILEGNPGHRPLPAGEPRPQPGRPTCPDWLAKEGKAEWRRLVTELCRLKLLAKIDRGALILTCQNWALFVLASGKLNTLANDPEAAGMDLRRWSAMANESAKLYLAGCARFGLTPADRTRIHTPPPADESDPLEELLRRANA